MLSYILKNLKDFDHISTIYQVLTGTSPRVMIIQGSVEKMPFVSGRFDLVTAFETVFF